MDAQRLIMTTGEDYIAVDGERLSRKELLLQLERIVESRQFRNSKRYPSFLRFVVEQTLAGSTESLKERTLGTDVFLRASDYDTNADPIVRVTAGEIRKRLAQYYQEPGHEHELRIDLPLGSYVPHFFGPGHHIHVSDREHAELFAVPPHTAVPHDAATAEHPEVVPLAPSSRDESGNHASHQPARRPLAAILIGLGMLALMVACWFMWKSTRERTHESGIETIWRPALVSPAQDLIVIGVHSLDSEGHERQPDSTIATQPEAPNDMLASMVRSDMVPVSDIVSYSRITDLLTRHVHPYNTMASDAATVEHLRHGPVILLGGLDNVWTLRLTSHLRFRFASHGQDESEIIDSQQPGTVWRFDNRQSAIVNTRDYAIVASYFDTTIEQPVLIVAGIGKTGTEIASEFMTSDVYLQSWLAQVKQHETRNVEIVLSTEILDGKAGPPHVVASTVW